MIPLSLSSTATATSRNLSLRLGSQRRAAGNKRGFRRAPHKLQALAEQAEQLKARALVRATALLLLLLLLSLLLALPLRIRLRLGTRFASFRNLVD